MNHCSHCNLSFSQKSPILYCVPNKNNADPRPDDTHEQERQPFAKCDGSKPSFTKDSEDKHDAEDPGEREKVRQNSRHELEDDYSGFGQSAQLLEATFTD